MKKPIVWTIAELSSGEIGIQSDIKVFNTFEVESYSVVTAITAQNSHKVPDITFTASAVINAQITELEKPKSIKLGMLGPMSIMQEISSFLKRYNGYVVCDPVILSLDGVPLLNWDDKNYLIENIIPYVDLLILSILEVEELLDCTIKNSTDIEKAARRLLNYGKQSVLIKGRNGLSRCCQDYWADGKQQYWITIDSRRKNHNSGNILSATITACLALGYSLSDALVIGKSYVSQETRVACQTAIQHNWLTSHEDLPWITKSAHEGVNQPNFPQCDLEALAFCPIVNSSYWLERLFVIGIQTIQLRIKGLQGKELEDEIRTGVEIAQKYKAKLFINDHWELAIRYNAYGIHLGQEDLISADCKAIAQAGMRLGISTHSYHELARAYALRPSYIAYGPIFPTTSKQMFFAPQGTSNLKRCRKLLKCSLVAIGGITIDNLLSVLECKVDGVAVISAVLSSIDPEQAALKFLKICKQAFSLRQKQ
ncbi:thiamine phosphate synthase [Wolbachia endosymbiont of Ctenocephalides felis wCfeT]|uniref:thiamine phosphate synthase n=1 Tax=Wolbachia endosymbiont of Ctenocephalides felis wCfeT TaxID=2732593 RepID=UPI001444DFFE|nr:thiamine phosphate synthase [Wolbachia endosymbiont of Ctenocephalides felis wCfeT]